MYGHPSGKGAHVMKLLYQGVGSIHAFWNFVLFFHIFRFLQITKHAWFHSLTRKHTWHSGEHTG